MLLGQYSTPISLFRATLVVPRSSRTHRRPLGPHQARYWPRIVAHGKRLWCPPPGPPITLANMRRQGVRSLIAHCLNDACRHQALIDVPSYPGEVDVPWFRPRVKCGKRVEVPRTRKERPVMPTKHSF